MMKKKIIEKLAALDLSKYPYEHVYKLIRELGHIGSIRVDLPVGKSIIRTRPNEENKVFNTREGLSYKPPENNRTYQRASTPYQTMFYGCPIPDTNQEGAEGSARVAATFETSYLMRKNLDGEQRMTFSRWRVKKPIPVFIVCHNRDYYSRNPWVNALYQQYISYARRMGEEEFKLSLTLNSYFADQFAKKIVDDTLDFEYMISAVFSEVTINKLDDNIGGIYYPSVKTDGMVYNVAIKPDYVDNSLELIAAGECTLYKKGNKCFLDAETACEIRNENEPFSFLPLGSDLHLGRETSLKRLEVM